LLSLLGSLSLLGWVVGGLVMLHTVVFGIIFYIYGTCMALGGG
jgi:hypothetical protein